MANQNNVAAANPLEQARLLPDSLEAIEALRKLATPGFWEPLLDEGNDIIGIVVNEPTYDVVTPEDVENGRDAEQNGTFTEIVANTAWDRTGNELERIDANTHYICRLHNVFPRIVAQLRGELARAQGELRGTALVMATLSPTDVTPEWRQKMRDYYRQKGGTTLG